jgi:putative nucleotidyltransferase with HDIG domain
MNSVSSSSKTHSYNLSRFWDFFFEPSSAIQKADERRKARLLSTFIVVLFTLFLGVNLSYYLLLPSYTTPLTDLIGYMFLFTTYLISRTKFSKIAVVLLMAMFPINIFGNILSNTSINPSITLTFLLPSYILCSLWFPIKGVFAYSLLNLYGITMLPAMAPGITSFSDILGAFAINIIGAVLVMIGMHHRNLIERDRQVELRNAYNRTLEGWARALELRDEGTELHSNRVTDLALKLAAAKGMGGEELDHIRRGAFLHDIGKMGIPNEILQKPGPLTSAEMKTIRQHPGIANELLRPIPYLSPALEIPYCHHERWDGGGYPRGLKGEEIPLSARIFAVVDVYDALLSDRPYRKAWSIENTLAYIKNESGKHFDPNIVEIFLKFILENTHEPEY